jgi:hypothetical protein
MGAAQEVIVDAIGNSQLVIIAPLLLILGILALGVLEWIIARLRGQ